MAVSVTTLFQAKTAEASDTTQYTAAYTTIIDKFTATNQSASVAATISVNLLSAIDSVGVDNLIVNTKTLQPYETYTFPELAGHVLTIGNKISTLASGSLTIRASGRVIS